MNLFLLVAPALVLAANPPFINPGTPAGVPPSFDCNVRQAAWERGQTLLPSQGKFRTLYDALQLQACGVPSPPQDDAWVPPTFVSASSTENSEVYVDAASGDDSNDGSLATPFKTLQFAVDQVEAGSRNATVHLRAGVYYTPMITLTPKHNGLTIQNYNGEHAVVSGGVPLNIPKSAWKAHKIQTG